VLAPTCLVSAIAAAEFAIRAGLKFNTS
jgi:hypothetical protein